MEFCEICNQFQDAIVETSIPKFKKMLTELRLWNENFARETCLKTLCNLTEKNDYFSFTEEIICDQLFKPQHSHFLLSVGSTLIYNTVRRNSSEETNALLSLLASKSRLSKIEVLDYLSGDGFSALHLCVIDGNKEAAKIILEMGSDCNKRSQDGNTALSLSIAYGYDFIVPLFIDRSDVNNQDNDHDTPLMFAAWNKQVEVMSALIQHGANVNTVSKYGSTALWNAVYQCSPECVSLLLSHNSRMDVACEGTHLFCSENFSMTDEEKVTKIYPGQRRSLLWVAVERIGFKEQSLQVLLILLEAGYDVTNEKWLQTTSYDHYMDTRMKTLASSSLHSMLLYMHLQPLSLKDLCRNNLRKYHILSSSLSFNGWLNRLGLSSTLKDFLTVSYRRPKKIFK